MGKLLVVTGAVLLVVGAVLIYAPWLLGWFGKLPGDISYRTGNTRIYIPITSMIVVSLLFTLLFTLFRR